MITRLFRFCCCPLLLLLPTLAWAADEPGITPALQPAQITTAPVQATLSKSAPAVAEPAQTELAKPVQVPPVKSTPAQAITPKPASVQPLAPKPASAPVHALPKKPMPAKPVPAPVATIPPLPAQASAPVPTANETETAAKSHAIDIEVFVREGCPQCDKAREFLTKLQNLRPQLKIIIRDVRKEPAALELLKRVAQNQGGVTLDYPAFVVGGQLIIGFSEEASTANLILDNLTLDTQTNQSTGKKIANCESIKDLGCGLIVPAPAAKPESKIISLFGHNIPLIQIGLPIFTVTMGMLDGFNHSSTWVLILMLSLLVPLKIRSAMFAIAGTFIATQGIIYFIFMSAWFHLFRWTGTSPTSEMVIAAIAFLVGIIYFKNYIFFGQNISISSQEISRPGIYTRIRKILEADNLTAALLATVVLAILVQLSELTYKSAFPALYTRILTLQHLDTPSNYAYLLLYDFAYMLDDILILIIGIITLKQERAQASEKRILKLISGLTMFGLGVYLLLLRY